MSATETEPAEGEKPETEKPKGKKKLFLLAAAGALVLAGGGGAAFFFLGSSGGGGAQEEQGAPAEKAAAHSGGEASGHGGEEAGQAAEFVDVPPMVVNLRSPDGVARYLKIHFMLVPGPNAAELDKQLPRVLDSYQSFLRELRPEDLAGSAAVFRIKEELLSRANEALGEGSVEDVLIQDLIQQ